MKDFKKFKLEVLTFIRDNKLRYSFKFRLNRMPLVSGRYYVTEKAALMAGKRYIERHLASQTEEFNNYHDSVYEVA